MTLKEIAQMAEVSPAAVSRYLNGGSLSEEKAGRIRKIFAETGYHPNQAAQSLRAGSVRQIGVIVPKIDSASVGEVVAGIDEVLVPAGYVLLLGSTGNKGDMEIQYLEMMQSNQVAGIILMGTTMTPMKKDAFSACSVPLVITGQDFEGFPCVYHDDFGAMKALTRRFLERGRKRIAYVGVDEADQAVGLERRRGVQSALREAGLQESALSIAAGWETDSGRQAAEEILKADPETDGILCATDQLAHGVLQALKAHGRKVPEEVSIAGVGDGWADEISIPALTTVKLYHHECGKGAAQILLQSIVEKDSVGPNRQIKLGFTILDRGSV